MNLHTALLMEFVDGRDEAESEVDIEADAGKRERNLQQNDLYIVHHPFVCVHEKWNDCFEYEVRTDHKQKYICVDHSRFPFWSSWIHDNISRVRHIGIAELNGPAKNSIAHQIQ